MTKSKTTFSVLKHAKKRCSDKGIKLTAKREVVLEGLVAAKKALSAYELADYCRIKLKTELLPMSVYRILEFLEQSGLAHRLNISNKYIACSHISCDHAHQPPQFLICKSCSKVEEVSIPERAIEMLTKATKKAGFLLADNKLEIECFCNNCAAVEA